MKISVIGSGYWGKNLVRNFHALNALHSICDSNPDTLASFKKDYPEVELCVSFSEVINNPDITGVAISTPAVTHATLAKEALLAGKDVYVEKPLCLSEKDGRELNRIAKEEGRILMIGHLLWYHPLVLKLKELIDAGELGRIQYIYSNRLNLGKLRREENVLWSFAPHDISVILGLTGEMPTTVCAQGGNFLHQQIADTTVTLLNFPSGTRAHIFVSWLHPFKEQMLVVVGDKQMAVFNDTAPWEEKLQLYPHTVKWEGNVPVADRAEAVMVHAEQEEPLRAECAHFLDCIAKRSRPRTDGEEGLRVLTVLNCCQESLEKGNTALVPVTGSNTSFDIHETAKVDDNVQIGAGTKVWHFSHILSGSIIGDSCSVGQNVVIGPDVRIGSGCKIQNNVSVYKGVELEDDVFCGPSMVFTNVLNPRSAVSRKKEFRKTLVRKGATIGANATIVCGVEIGESAFIGAGAVVTHDVPAFALMTGNPAKQTGWMSRHGEKLGLPLQGEGEDFCPHTCEKYVLKDGKVSISQ
ncbi:UDP-2-acetamido-3-amino-2,3-dideoxy-glucuronate N-acetyltransferase [Candidatus Electrothrix aarhusensis]|uniref:UDP-2-acetamido-3-amino-2,3-dideoxy-glucuronate N-acetyltransferase n=1 Tax=Candidatus Electrothrix aarhusensis TaxID=1859131 RepID=A0A3S3R8G6_9BACT|nr:UDP-2-acetamido-3-amino-2,3-dideoxy-glucuronate N-acetyltransferase [Candidatus Electrothrix aarhusensis]